MAILDPESASRPDANQDWRAPGEGEAEPNSSQTPEPLSKANRWRLLLAPFYKLSNAIGRFLNFTIFSSLTQRIIVLNLAGLLVLVVGILYLNQWRAGLIDARVQSLRVQGEIIAAAIAASATADSDVISINPDRLLQLQGDGTVSSLSYFDPSLEFPISQIGRAHV